MTSGPRRHEHADLFVTSSFCTTGGCVGVRFEADLVQVVDTKSADTSLRFDRTEWAAFVAGVKAGEFDLG